MIYGQTKEFSELVGKVLTYVDLKDDEIIFNCEDGTRYRMNHWQDCCETVEIESITGDLSDLIGSPILLAEEVVSEDAPPLDPDDEKYGSYTWTFYKLATQ